MMLKWILLYVGTSAFAGGTSAHNLAHGCVELNPLAPDRPVFNLAYKSGMTVGLSYTFVLADRRKRGSGKWLVIGAGAVNVADGLFNLSQQCGR